MLFMFPADYFDHRAPEGLYQAEWVAAGDAGADRICIDFDDVLAERDPFPSGFEGAGRLAVWRGWQMSIRAYEAFHRAATGHGLSMLTPPEAYSACHSLAESYPRVARRSQPTVFLHGSSFPAEELRSAVEQVAAPGGAAFVKDFVKGMRSGSCRLVPDMYDEVLESEVGKLLADRGESYAGGIAVRRWADMSGETRFFVVDGKVVAVEGHSRSGAGKPAVTVPMLARMIDLSAAGGGSRFYTVDVARILPSGELTIVELGDGQVSGCEPDSVKAIVRSLSALDLG